MTPDQRERYARNILIPGFGEAGQERLADARVCIVGAGGLGSPVALYLAAAGVGTLGIVDPDRVELSNLQRQVLHTTPDIGARKVDSAAEAITALNPDVTVDRHALRLTEDNADEVLAGYDVVVEATDNFDAKFMLNDACLRMHKPLATAGILALSGQCLFVAPGQSPCLRCVVPEPPDGVPTTAEQGVLGAVPGILGSVEAFEVIRWLTGLWQPAEDGSGQLHSVDGELMRLRTMRVPRRSDCRCASSWST
ncbi:MAG: HesA/MoeB/ThiF family protein [bacterium]|nr:HesA/MoeB/ThiF family protein [bacterium]